MSCSRRSVALLGPAALALVTLLVALAPAPAAADASTDQGGELYSIEKRRLMGHHELSSSVGTMPLDAFGKGITLQGSYTYHFSHLIAWELFGGAYSFIVSTELREDLERRFRTQPERAGDLVAFVHSNFELKPLYGKIAWLNDSLLAAEVFLVAGPALGFFDDNSRPFGANAGVGLRFFLGRYFSARLDIRDYVFLPGFNDVTNHLYISLGLGLTFGFSETDQEE